MNDEWNGSSFGRRYVDRDAKRLPLVVTPEDADRKARREFWRGVWTGTALAWLAMAIAVVVLS